MKKFWITLELAILVVIMVQISSLTSFTGKDDPGAEAVRAATVASVNLFLKENRDLVGKDGPYTPSFPVAQFPSGIAGDTALQDLAAGQAQQILQSGDIGPLQKQLEGYGISQSAPITP